LSGGAPTNGAALALPAGISHLNCVNDLTAGAPFSSIEIDGLGYTISGNAIVLIQGIATTYSSGTSTDSVDTQLGGAVCVAAGGELDLNGALTGSVGLTISGGGTVKLSGTNTYTGITDVEGSGTSLGRGSHTIRAAYAGDANFASSQSGSAQDTVAAARTQTYLEDVRAR
jgi:autotransporter-associated beta strand protein